MLRWKASTTYSGQADVMFAGAAIKGLGKVGNFGPSALFAGAVFDMDRFVVVTNFSLRGLVEMCFPIAPPIQRSIRRRACARHWHFSRTMFFQNKRDDSQPVDPGEPIARRRHNPRGCGCSAAYRVTSAPR